jgi:hypothetical protein
MSDSPVVFQAVLYIMSYLNNNFQKMKNLEFIDDRYFHMSICLSCSDTVDSTDCCAAPAH